MFPRSATTETRWLRCKYCGHKLGKIVKPGNDCTKIEIKCHSCKAIDIYSIGKER